MIKNPFITTGYVGPEFFCDREKETDDLIRILTNGNNVALISPRRYGKTDLLRHCFSQPDIQREYYCFIVDLYSTKSIEEMVAKMGSVILEALKPRGKKVWERFVSALSSVRGGISFDMNGLPSWTLEVGDMHSPQVTLDEIFAYLQHADRPCLVALDEFQQITKYSDSTVEAALRTHVQFCNNAHFVFSGSRQHLMGNMFTSPARPFYQSVTIYSLRRIPLEKYLAFCQHHFSLRHKQVNPEVVTRLYTRFDGVTYYIQRVMNELFSRTPEGGTCRVDDIDASVQSIIDQSSPIYEDLLYQLPEKQSRVLLAIGKEGKASNLTSGKFFKKYGLPSPNSVKSAVPALIEKGLVSQENGCYEIYDKFFQLWLVQNTI